MILHGDCLERMREMDAESVDAIVTDPPYGISFMSRKWDYDVPSVDVWREALRVLKPGGHLLAFGGTRTYHRMVVNIEDAGFEVRDQLQWVYGQGFPKSLNVSKTLDGTRCSCGGSTVPYDHAKETKPANERDLRSVREGDVSQAVHARHERGQVLLPSLSQPGTPAPGRAELPSDGGAGESRVEGRRDVLQEEGQLQEHPIPTGAGVGASDGTSRRIHHGAPARDGAAGGATTEPERSGTPPGPRSRKQSPRQLRTVAEQRDAQKRGAWPTCDGCGKPIVPDGLGSALKPSNEPVCMARKPFPGTVAANVLEYGTGAINVDACRIGTGDDRTSGGLTLKGSIWGSQGTDRAARPDGGRWPPNVLLGCACEDEHEPSCAVALLDAQSGERKLGGQRKGAVEGISNQVYAKGWVRSETLGYGDTGGASRFYYVAKASKAERNMGCEGLPAKRGGSEQFDSRWKEGTGADRMPVNQNTHPTVKPVAVMRWLVRLVCPPGGLVLDPFAGSGTTGVACAQEGFRFVGIERELEYCEIARRRIAAAVPDQGDLLSEAA